MTQVTVQATTDGMFPIRRTCGCSARGNSGRSLPLRFAANTVRQLRSIIKPDQVIQSYRCVDCKHIVVIRGRDLDGLAPR